MNIVIAALVASVAGLAVAVQVQAGGDKVAFPADYGKGVVYMTLDRPENKQVREYYTSQAAIDAAKKGEPLPQNTVITVVQYAAQLDPQGNPAKDANGRFSKTANILGYTVMEKSAGWGAEYPETQRNGEWEYQAFRADKSVAEKMQNIEQERRTATVQTEQKPAPPVAEQPARSVEVGNTPSAAASATAICASTSAPRRSLSMTRPAAATPSRSGWPARGPRCRAGPRCRGRPRGRSPRRSWGS